MQESRLAPMIICGLVHVRLPTKRVQTTTGSERLQSQSLQIKPRTLFLVKEIFV